MSARLGTCGRFSARSDRDPAKDPARLAAALDIDRALDGTAAVAHPGAHLFLLHGSSPPPDQARNGPRTGVGGDGAALRWRFRTEGPGGEPVPRPRTTPSADLTRPWGTPNVVRAA
ncbi:DNA-3-methyladenine glycosylase [Streptomyces sp. OR43]|uniref:DNA-3-methyladenine glycosylase n=1 Tax=Streptomyces sp. or43 TaxID=2478957 RepID=UPI0039673DA3